MPRKFAFTASEEVGELQLGGYEADSISEPMQLFPMAGYAYGVNVTSIKFGETELLNFVGEDKGDAYVGEFDSGTTCLLIPNGTVNNTFHTSPFQILLDEQNKGGTYPLIYTIGGREYSIAYEECVEPADRAMILGDPWFRKFIVLHDLEDLNDKKMGLALRNPNYQLGVETNHEASSTLKPSIALGKMQLLAELSNKQVDKIRAHRRVRHSELAMTKVTYEGTPVDKVALRYAAAGALWFCAPRVCPAEPWTHGTALPSRNHEHADRQLSTCCARTHTPPDALHVATARRAA